MTRLTNGITPPKKAHRTQAGRNIRRELEASPELVKPPM